jgi:hypothetical protein
MNVRSLTEDELEILFYWERADNVNGYIFSRILQLASKGWGLQDISLAMGVEVDTARQVIIDFNLGGIPAIAPKP